MSIKKLFGKSFRSYESASVDVESPTFITNTVRERETYLPPIDFATASNFVKYGSAKLYYEKSISRIYDDFPYDGSKAEKINFHQSSSYLDRWMFEVKYPKTTGYVTLGKTTSYTAPDAALITAGYYPTSVDEYVRVWGGLHTASAGMIGDQLQKNFDSSIKFDNALNRMQNWRLDLVSGSTVEFWLQKPSFGTTLGTGLPLTAREVILDLWNGEATGSDNYGRLTIEITASGTPDPDGACFQATLQSGTYGFMTSSICSTTVTTSSLSSWHHYAISFVSAAGGIKSRFYVDGEENLTQTINCGERVGLSAAAVGEIPGLITGYLGALQQRPSGNVFSAFDMQGYGKFSGSLDEFRFWKNRRTSRQIELNWFRQIGGGANTDKNTTDLGVYFTFNEGIVGSTGIDRNVLDFSGRLANGYWEGYTSGARSTNSAFNLSAQNLTESQTPIMYSFHPSVTALETEMTNSGSLYDNEYGSSFYTSLPNWLQEEDGLSNKNLKYVSQILSSYFDTLYAQISALSNLKNKGYLESQYKAPPFARQLLESKGFITKDLFVDSKIVELFSSADFDAIKFENNITEIKNLIYLNIYNNLEKIYKSKGTEKSIRNFIRCFGIDDEIIKLNMYTDGGIHYFTDKAKGTSVKKKYLNFNSSSFWGATIFQTTGSADNALTFISGSDASTISASWSAFTFEADIVVPYKAAATEIGYFNTPFLSSSIFGFLEANESDVASYTWNKPEVADLQVYLTRDELNSKNARFTLKNQDGTINWASNYIEDIYDNNHWNLAIRIKPDTYPYAGKRSNIFSASLYFRFLCR